MRVNCGGFARDGFQGDPGQPDGSPGYTTDEIDANVDMAAPQAVYQTGWWGDSSYACTLKTQPVQTYTVRLHFAELDSHTVTGKRVFDVGINGRRVLTDFDVFKAAGGYHKALVKQFTGVAPDETGSITIHVQKGKTNSPQISGIEILKDAGAH